VSTGQGGFDASGGSFGVRRACWAGNDVMTTALAHDYLTQRGGAERVVLAMHRALPDAPIHTSLYESDTTFPEFAAADVRVSALDRIGPIRRNHRLALPLLAPIVSSMRVDADVVLCSSSGWAHGVRTDGRKVVYCHAPARWLYQRDAYLAQSGSGSAAALRVLDPFLRRWDRKAAATADHYIANSSRTRDLVREAYGIDAELLFPPHGIDPDGPRSPVAELEPGYLLCVSRLLAYKNVDAVIGAMAHRPDDRLIVVGAGPDGDRLHGLAPANVTFLSGIGDDELRWLYANARALVAASYEDFGLTPVEAAAFGVPSAVLDFCGYHDTVRDGETGVYFPSPDALAINGAIDRLDADPPDPEVVAAHAATFSPARFRTDLERILEG
jgi:glycosyltransferase involved in cell wall biosynthesis